MVAHTKSFNTFRHLCFVSQNFLCFRGAIYQTRHTLRLSNHSCCICNKNSKCGLFHLCQVEVINLLYQRCVCHLNHLWHPRNHSCLCTNVCYQTISLGSDCDRSGNPSDNKLAYLLLLYLGCSQVYRQVWIN